MIERNAARKPVLVVGSVGLDTVETPFGAAKDVLGGAASYAATAAAFFTDVRLVAAVGADFPQDPLDFFRNRGIDLSGVQCCQGDTFRWNGYYEYDMNQAHTLATHLNILADFVPQIPEAFRETPYVFLANIDPDIQLAALDQLHRPAFVMADAMNFWINGKRERVLDVMRRVDAVTINDAEARQLCATTNLVAAGRQLLDMGPRVVIIKEGVHGALMFTHNDYFVAPSFPLEEVHDPTGAGSAFAGGVIGHLAFTDDLSEENLRKAVVYGAVMASYTVEEFSLARLMRLEPGEIILRYAEMRKMTAIAD